MVTIDWGTKVISIPQADLTFISGSLYELDVDSFRLALKDLEDGEVGMVFPRTHNHNAEVTVGGVTLARVVEIVNGYTVTFTPDSQWAVRLVGANNNIADVLNVNQVQLRTNNTAGMVATITPEDVWAATVREITGMAAGAIPAGAFGVGAIDAAALAVDAGQEVADRVLARALAGGADGGRDVRDALRILRNRVEAAGGTFTVYEEDDSTIAWQASVTTDSGADPIRGVDPD